MKKNVASSLIRLASYFSMGAVFLSALLNALPPDLLFESGEDYLKSRGVSPEVMQKLAPGRDVYIYGDQGLQYPLRYLHEAWFSAQRDLGNPDMVHQGFIEKGLRVAGQYGSTLAGIGTGREHGLAYALAPSPGQGAHCFVRLPATAWDAGTAIHMITGLPKSLIERVPFKEADQRLAAFFHEAGHCPQPLSAHVEDTLSVLVLFDEAEPDANGIPLFLKETGNTVMTDAYLHMVALGAFGLRPGTGAKYDNDFQHATALILDAVLKGRDVPTPEETRSTYVSLEQKIFSTRSFKIGQDKPYMIRVAAGLRDILDSPSAGSLTVLERKAADLYLEGMKMFAPKAYERDTASVSHPGKGAYSMSPS